MPPQTRQKRRREVVEDDCDCGAGHTSTEECQEAAEAAEALKETAAEAFKETVRENERLKKHRDVTISIILSSFNNMRAACAGANHELFYIHDDLLILHTNIGSNSPLVGAYKPGIISVRGDFPSVRSLQFAKFIAWIYTGELTQHNFIFGDGTASDWENLWAMGEQFLCAGFQNYCMDRLRKMARDRADDIDKDRFWPKVEDVRMVLKEAEKESPLRQFMIDCLACNNPLKHDLAGCREWEALLESDHTLGKDLYKATARDWEGAMPWDLKWRGRYMILEGEIPLDQKWRNMILETTTEKELEEEAAETDSAKSKLKLSVFNKK